MNARSSSFGQSLDAEPVCAEPVCARARWVPTLVILAVFSSACASVPKRHAPDFDVYHLSPAQVGGRAGSVALRQGAIIDAHTGQALSPTALRKILARYDVIYVGENHASVAHQDWEAAIIALLAEDARPLAVGLEMLPQSVQPILASRRRGTSERDFLRRIQWAEHWGYNYFYYRAIFRVTGSHQIPLVALNAPDALPRSIARQGLAKLPPKLRALLPPLDLSSKAHRRLFRALLGPMRTVRTRAKAPAGHPQGAKLPVAHPKAKAPHGHHGLTGDRLERYYTAQVVWDAVMADAVLRWRQRVPQGRVVVLAGVGHVLYDLGISRQLRRRAPTLRQLIVLPVRVAQGRSRRVSRQAADILIGIAPPAGAVRPPRLGVELKAAKGVVRVETLSKGDTPARRAGLRPGDRIRAIAGQPIATIFDLRWALLETRRGHLVPLQVVRQGKPLDLIITL